MSAVRPFLATLLLALVALSGCIAGGEDAPTEAPTVTKEECVAEGVCGADAVVDETTGRDLRIDLTAEDTLQAPKWKVGDVFEQHVYYGSADTSGEHIVTMVTDDSGDCYQFGTTSQNAAKFEAVFDLPFLGCVGKDLSTTGFWGDWDWMYDFPLEDGKTWDGRIDFMYNWNSNDILFDVAFTLTSTFEPKVNTPKGDFPGFIIIGTTEDGEELLRYNYVPAVGWFSHFWLYDLDTPEATDVILHMMSMGRSDGYTGTYYIDEADEVIESFSFLGGAPIFDGNGPPVDQFTVSADATYLKGIVVPIACPGRAQVSLITPSNQVQQYEHSYEGAPEACASGPDSDGPAAGSFTVNFIDQAAEGGDWKLVGAGTGFGGYFVWLWEVIEVQYELTEDMLPKVEDGQG